MVRKMIASLLAVTAALPAFSTVSAETELNDAAVSGYVSVTDENGGLELVSADKTPAIYVDENDFEGVVRAVGDLRQDIKSVTGKGPDITNEVKMQTSGEFSEGIKLYGDAMTIELADSVPEECDAYIAAYDNEGNLTGVAKSNTRLSSGQSGFSFDTVLEKTDGGSIKGFVWQGMKPVTKVLGIAKPVNVELTGADIVVGTLGKSSVVDSLVQNGNIDVSDIQNKWESFTIQRVDDAIVIAGSDKRGTIYGIYDLCEKIGVSPWNFWADTVSGHAGSLYINLPDGGYTEGEPSVQYRGIFLNDEFNMSEWSKSMGNTGANMNNATYEKIFELLLRLKANYLWPAMHTYSIAFNNTMGNAELADKYGIVMGSSHCEPLLRNNLGELYIYQQEWTHYNPEKKLYINTADDAKNNVSWMWTDKDGSGNSVDNKEFLTDYWRTRVEHNGNYENSYTLGMRGVHDGKFSTNMDSKTAMSEIIAAQRKILTDELCGEDKDISDVLQIFIPYKEMLDLYNGGLQVPDDVTLMWPDDNFGYIRQLPTDKERERSGGAGIYYHLSYFGRPTSYLWLGTTQPGLIREEMTKAYDMGAKKVWVANVGDLKPAETEIEYFLDLARDVEKVRNTDIGDWLAENAKRDFGFDDTQAKEYADIKLAYYENANSRRPEHFVNGLFSMNFGDEGQILIDNYSELENNAEKLYNSLSDDRKPSFYELMLYPLKGAKNMAEKYIYSDKANRYKEMGYGAAVNKYAKLSDDAYQRIIDDTKEYTTMLGGKWDKMMNPYQTQLKGSFGGPISGKLDNPNVSELSYTEMKIVYESMTFTNFSLNPKYADILNIGTGSFDWRASADKEWIKINKTSGRVADDDRIYITVDLSKVPDITESGATETGEIVFEQLIGETVIDTQRVPVVLNLSETTAMANEKTYIENDGYVSIEAEHYSNSVKNGEYEWKPEKDFGRSGGSVKAYPNTAKSVSSPNKDNSAYLEYSVYFTSKGTFPIDVYRMPSINELSGAAMRCRIGIDDNTPVQFNGNTKTTDNSTGQDAWGRGVLQNADIISGNITVSEPGLHTIRLYNESPSVVIDKFVITTGKKKDSYFGAPESYNTTYNNQMKPLPEPKTAAEEQTGSITPLFEPSVIITNVSEAGEVSIKRLNEDITEGIFVIASYDEDGNMVDAAYKFCVLSDTDTYKVGLPILNGVPMQCMFVRGQIDETGKIISGDWEALAPAYTKILAPVGDDVSLTASYDEGYVYPAAKMKDYIGKESVCVISEMGSDNVDGIKYIRQNTVREDTYNKLKFNGEGKFDLKIKVAGESGIISETFSTVKNISTDTEATSTQLYNWDFETDQTGTGTNVPVLGGNAVYHADSKSVKLTPTASAGGNLSVELADAVAAAHGEKITVVSKIAYGNLSGKYMTYELTDSNGKMLVRSHINRYTGKTQSLTIGGAEQLTDGNYPSAILKIDNNATTPKGKFTTYTTVIDPAANEITLTISNEANSTVNVYSGKLPEGTSYDLKKIYFTTDYDNAGRSCYVDDISVSKSKAASYAITFLPLCKSEVIESAVVRVTDAVTGALMRLDADGKYNLCDGVYNYTVKADGYADVNDTLELSAATESKEIIVEMTRN